MSEPMRMTITKDGVACSMSFTEVTPYWLLSDCKLYSIGVAPFTAKPFAAFLRAPHNNPDKDGVRPSALHLGAFEQLKGRDSAIAACIRHKRTQPIDTTTQQQELTV
jgi:hypothetical protein